jgi:hypothetical protein
MKLSVPSGILIDSRSSPKMTTASRFAHSAVALTRKILWMLLPSILAVPLQLAVAICRPCLPSLSRRQTSAPPLTRRLSSPLGRTETSGRMMTNLLVILAKDNDSPIRMDNDSMFWTRNLSSLTRANSRAFFANRLIRVLHLSRASIELHACHGVCFPFLLCLV